MRMVPSLDKLKDRQAGFGLRLAMPSIEQFTFERGEEALTEGVVETVAGRAHRGADASFFTPGAEGDRGGLRSLIAVVNPRVRLALHKRHVQRICHQLCSQMAGHVPTDDATATGIQHDSTRQETGPRSHWT